MSECHSLLVIDEDSKNLETLKNILSGRFSDLALYQAKTVAEGLKLLSDHPVDLVLLDEATPKENPNSACSLIATEKKENSFLFLLLTSSQTPASQMKEALEAGVDDFLRRPFDDIELISRVGTLFRSMKAAKEYQHRYKQLEKQSDATLQELRQNEDRLKMALNGGNLGLWDWDITSGNVFYNERWAKLIGYSLEELEQSYQTWEKLLHPDEKNDVLNALQKNLDGKTPFFQAKMRLKTKSEKWRWFHGKGTVVSRDKAGQPLRAVGTMMDITEQKQAEQALRENEERLKSIYQATDNVAFILTDTKGKDSIITECSPGAEKLFGYRRDELIGKKVAVLHNAKDVENFPAMQDALREGYIGFNGETTLFRKNGEQFPALFTLHPRYSADGTFLGSIGVSVDISLQKQNEEKLARAEAFLSAIIEQSPVPMAVASADGTLPIFNDACRDLLMIEDDIKPGDSLFNMKQTWKDYDANGNPLPMDQLPLAKATKGIKTEGLEVKVVRKDGSVRWELVSGTPIYDKNGELIAGFIIFPDITKRKKAEEALEESESRYRELFENINSGVAVYEAVDNGNDFIFKDFNRTAERIEDIDRKEILGKRVTEAFPGVKDFGLFEILQRVWETGQPESLPASLYEKGRLKRWRENFVYKLPTGEIVAVYDDVTRQKLAELELERSEARAHALLDATQETLVLIDKEGIVLLSNETGARRVKMTVDELIGKNIYEQIPPDVAKSRKVIIDKVFQTKQGLAFEDQRKDFFFLNSVYPALDDTGNVVGVAIFAQDITSRKKVEKERMEMDAQLRHQQKLESIGTLASGVAHEINNPLNGIMNYAQIIVNKLEENHPLHNFSKEIVFESQRVATIVQNLLSFARQEKQIPQPAAISAIIDSTLSLLKNAIKIDQIHLEVDAPKDLPNVSCRSQQIQQVIMNLVTNAKDALNDKYEGYHEDKIIFIQARLVKKKDIPFIRIMVKDHGKGIPPEKKDRIFDPFYTTKAPGKGTGLGLSVSFGIVSEHNGLLWVESEPGKFTSFFIDLPLHSDPDSE